MKVLSLNFRPSFFGVSGLIIEIVVDFGDGEPQVVLVDDEGVRLHQIEEHVFNPAPGILIDKEVAAEAMESLWQCHIRPISHFSNQGEKGAIKEHLNDMRQLVASKLKVPLKGTDS